MIKTIIFDVGGVFVKGSFDPFLKEVSEILGVELRRDSIPEEIMDDWMRGKVTFVEFLEKISGLTLSKEDAKRIFDFWINNWEIDSDMIEFARRFKRKYKLIMLSNADKEGVEKREKMGDQLNFFDHKFRSFELGFVKPEREIYEHVLKKLKLNPKECVFIDDKPVNVEVAEELGIHGIVFQDKQQLIHDLQKLGVEV